MLWHGAQAGAFDLKAAVLEVMTAFRRAGEQAGMGGFDLGHRELIGSLPKQGNKVRGQPGVTYLEMPMSDLNRQAGEGT